MEDKVGVPTRTRGVGLIKQLILRSVASGHRTDHELKRICKQHISGDNLNNVLRSMTRDRLLMRSRGNYYIGSAGRAQTQKLVVGAPAMKPYIPPKTPPRRAGSDASHIPSRFGDERVPHWSARELPPEAQG